MPTPARQAFVGVGANLGDRWATIRSALAQLARAPGVLALESSAVFETAPVDVTDQPVFLNLVVGVETILAPGQLLDTLLAHERAAGRNREKETRWGPRTLDLDLLLFEGATCASPGLTLPHPRLWERSFVLVPLQELVLRSPRFHQPAWQELRARLAKYARPATGISVWTPPAA
jgi:2-amino-4-hydroxy-6-hydroxymethyldihydropteridine diphosphokinase